MKKILSLVLALVMALSLTTVAWGAEVTVANATAAQDALDNAVPGTTIKLTAGVDYGTLVFGQNASSRVVDITDVGGDAPGNEHYSRYENITILGAAGATVDQIDFKARWIDGTEGGSYVDIKNLTIKGVTFSGEKTAVKIDGAMGGWLGIDGLKLEDCKMVDADGADRFVFQQITGYKDLNDKTAGTYVMTTGVKNLTITGCEVEGAYQVIESRAMENLTITNNTFKNIKARDMLITSDTTYHPSVTYTGTITITGNTSIGGEERFVRASLNNSDATLVIANNTLPTYAGADDDCIKADGVTGAATIKSNTLPADKTVTLNSIEGAIEITTNTNGKITSGTFNTDVSANVADSNTVVAKVNNVYIVGENDVKAAATVGAKVTVLQGSVTLNNGTTLNSTSGEYTVPQPPVYYPVYVPTVEDTKVDSAQTFDAGIALYVGMSVMGAVGTVALSKKRED